MLHDETDTAEDDVKNKILSTSHDLLNNAMSNFRVIELFHR